MTRENDGFFFSKEPFAWFKTFQILPWNVLHNLILVTFPKTNFGEHLNGQSAA